MLLIQMNGKEFIAKILGGEKDLKGIILPEYYDLTDHEEYGTMQQYLKEHIDERIDLSDSIMIGIVATGIYLPRVIARGTYLRGANLGKAYLGGAYLGRADLEEANLGGAYLGKANLRGANLGKAYLGRADLEEADLEEAYLGKANLRGANLRGAYLGKAYLGGAYLEEAYLGKANLRGANLREANLIGVKNFETTINFEDATFNCAVMDPETKEIIIAARRATEETYVVE